MECELVKGVAPPSIYYRGCKPLNRILLGGTWYEFSEDCRTRLAERFLVLVGVRNWWTESDNITRAVDAKCVW
jgi:hypothetical protein